jgi:hypothetical protein
MLEKDAHWGGNGAYSIANFVYQECNREGPSGRGSNFKGGTDLQASYTNKLERQLIRVRVRVRVKVGEKAKG